MATIKYRYNRRANIGCQSRILSIETILQGALILEGWHLKF